METKLCRDCKIEKPLDAFYFNRTQGGYKPQCKKCCLAQDKARYQANPEAARERSKSQWYKHHEKRLAYAAEYRNRPENRERILQYHRIPEHRVAGLERSKQWALANPERFADNKRKANYGVPYGWYAKTLAEQGGKCAICETTDPGGKRNEKGEASFYVDHDHGTKQVRGLLCHNCNFLIGHSKEDPSILDNAASYIRYYKLFYAKDILS